MLECVSFTSEGNPVPCLEFYGGFRESNDIRACFPGDQVGEPSFLHLRDEEETQKKGGLGT